MSKQNAAKKARRKKRLTTRNDSWLPAEVHAEVQGIAQIADQIVPRGWVYDDEYSTDDFITWYYPASGIELDDDDVREPVTRIWVSDPQRPQLVLVGTAEDGAIYSLDVEQLSTGLDAIEAFRVGDPLLDLEGDQGKQSGESDGQFE